MDNHRFLTEVELILKGLDLAFEYLVFVIKIRHIGHNEVKINTLRARLFGLGSDVTDHFGQSS